MHVLQESIALPDVHSGYGFAIGNVAAFDVADLESIVSPGGVGFDINCDVRLIRTNMVWELTRAACAGELPKVLPQSSIMQSLALYMQMCSIISCISYSGFPSNTLRTVSTCLHSGRVHCYSSPQQSLDTNLQMEADVADVKDELAQTLFDHIPVGVGSQGIIATSAKDLEAALEMGMDWSLREVSPAPPLPAIQQGVMLTLTIGNCQLCHTLMKSVFSPCFLY